MTTITKKLLNKYVALPALMLLPTLATIAQNAATAPTAPVEAPTDGYTVLRYLLAAVSVMFLIIIIILSIGIKTGSEIFVEKMRSNKAKTVTVIAFMLLSVGAYAQTPAPAVAAAKQGIPSDIWFFVAVIAIEFIAILVLVWLLYYTLEIKSKQNQARVAQGKPAISLFDRLNNAVPIEEEETLDLAHSYDGIRELDNKIPNWWSWTFYATILFSVIYLYRMFISGTLPDQYTELALDKEVAAAKQAEYLKLAGANVDEKTVKMADAAGVAKGKETYTKNCTPCHGDKGQGISGPNLTDDYWIHKGGLGDIFYSIKYGWPEKGMISWKEQLSPAQIAEVSSYIKSLKGSNPAGAKEKQGELWTDGATAAPTDSTAAPKADTTKK